MGEGGLGGRAEEVSVRTGIVNREMSRAASEDAAFFDVRTFRAAAPDYKIFINILIV